MGAKPRRPRNRTLWAVRRGPFVSLFSVHPDTLDDNGRLLAVRAMFPVEEFTLALPEGKAVRVSMRIHLF